MKIFRIMVIAILVIFPLFAEGGKKKIIVDGTTFQFEEGKIPYCCGCENAILSDVQQLSCGDYTCLPCAEKLGGKAPKCYSVQCDEPNLTAMSKNKFYMEDKFKQKEINKIEFECMNKGCEWKGATRGLGDHAGHCSYKKFPCPIPGCTQVVGKEELERHRSDFDAHKSLLLQAYPEIIKVLEKHHAQPVDPDQRLNERMGQLAMGETGELTRDGVTRENPVVSLPYTRHDLPPEGSCSGVCSKCHTLQKELNFLKSSHTKLTDRVQQAEAALKKAEAEKEDSDFRLSLMENSNHDGSMLWKVPQISQRFEDAKSGRITSIFSLPFYSGKYGYKMCLRLYILGDGEAKNSSSSLFLVLMKGEFDNVLSWPFNHKVTFKLFNQCRGDHVVESFHPDPLTSSFQKPKSDMNVGSGLPYFVPIKKLMRDGFVVEDTLFIKVEVDTSTMNHP